MKLKTKFEVTHDNFSPGYGSFTRLTSAVCCEIFPMVVTHERTDGWTSLLPITHPSSK